ncbi:hypothetical protein K7X08_032570 [Anisodus acutangulus]|uniref:Putative E3 ubiquitin-protein ligase LIN N-terminal domain-containing protein n=1 Tax=Anisodus acutangulus TaxID=402998 RepID=A0A9Q1RNI7_9SOLA|nr:hypothetical protein K7X08_032570 [Anisodus acutangulus]
MLLRPMATLDNILRHTTVFLSETLLQSDLHHRLFSVFSQSADQTPLNLAVETIENAASTTSNSFSLRLAEKILLSFSENTFSSFLLSLVYTLQRRPVDAALSLLDVFHTDPSIARLEIAPLVFQDLFLIPILQWYNHKRSRIISCSISLNSGYRGDDDESVQAISAATKSLSAMSGEQASELKDLEREYEEILDENCRVLLDISRRFCEPKVGTESEAGNEDMNKRMALLNTRQRKYLNEKQPILGESSCHPDPLMEDYDNMQSSGKNTPPKVLYVP